MAGNPNTVAEALRHHALGFATIPVATNGKRPTMKDWAKHPVTDPKMTETYLGNPGTQNYGLVMPPDSPDKVVVLDLDDGDGATEPWKARIKRQMADLGELPRTKFTETPSGGRHLFFRWSGDLPKGDQFLGWTLRVLNGRHQVLGPGSIVDGKAYVDRFPQLSIATMPQTWLDAFRGASTAPAATIRDLIQPKGPLIEVAPAIEGYEMPVEVSAGGRYAAIRDFVASRWNRGLGEDELWALVRDVLAPRFTVPLTESELRERFDRTLTGISARLGAPAASLAAPEPSKPLDPSAKASLFVPIDDYRAATPTTIPWIAEPFAYLGGVTLISGAPKAGKSSLAANLQRCRERDELFLGSVPVPNGPTLLITEEGGIPVVYKTEGMHELIVMDRRSAVSAGLDWVGMLNEVAEWALAHPEALIFIDTLAIWAGLKDENDASGVTVAIGQVAMLAQKTQSAVVLVHHARKGGGENGEGIRGSGAILATVDLSLELTRVDGQGEESDDRNLDVAGRVVMPQRHRLQFDRSTLTYSMVDPDVAQLNRIEKLLEGVPLKGAKEGASRDQLRALWRKDPRRNIEMLLTAGRLREELTTVPTSRGTTKALRYWAIPAVRVNVRREKPLAQDDVQAVDED